MSCRISSSYSSRNNLRHSFTSSFNDILIQIFFDCSSESLEKIILFLWLINYRSQVLNSKSLSLHFIIWTSFCKTSSSKSITSAGSCSWYRVPTHRFLPWTDWLQKVIIIHVSFFRMSTFAFNLKPSLNLFIGIFHFHHCMMVKIALSLIASFH